MSSDRPSSSSSSSSKTGLSVKSLGAGPYQADRQEQLRHTSAAQVAAGGRRPARSVCTAHPCASGHGCPPGQRCQELAVTYANAPLGMLCRDCFTLRLQDAMQDRQLSARFTPDQMRSVGTPSELDTEGGAADDDQAAAQ